MIFTTYRRWLALLLAGWVALAGAEEPRFDVWEFAISGNTVLETRVIEQVVYPYLGPGRTVADVERARQALERSYAEAGYATVVVNIPEQDVLDGVVRLDVLEGVVDRLIVSGSRYFSPERIRGGVPSLSEGGVPRLPEVQRELARLNAASADRQVTPVLRPGRFPGTVEVELQVDDTLPVSAVIEFNDRYTRDTTRTRLLATLGYNNLWQREHSATVGYQTSPQDTSEVKVLFGTYTARLPGSQWLVSGYAVTSDSAVATIGSLGVLGSGQIYGLRLIRPLPQLAGGFQRLALGVDRKDFEDDIRLDGVPSGAPELNPRVKYWTLTGGWGLTWLTEDQSRTTDLGLQLVVAPRLLDNDPAEFELKRAGASASFTHLGLTLSHERESWQGTLLRGVLNAQLASGALISNEQLGFGGATTVRGYLDSQQFVDDGYNLQLEWLSPDFAAAWPGFDSGRLHLFVDGGGGRLRDALPEQDSSFFLWSAGLGLRTGLWRGLSAELEHAWPLRDTADGSIESGDSRWHFNLRFEF